MRHSKWQLFNYGLFEAKVKTATKTKTRAGVLDPLSSELSKQLPAKVASKTIPNAHTKTASAAATRNKTKNIGLATDPQAMRHMMDLTANLDKLDISQEQDIEGTEPELTTPETLPAVINKQVMSGKEKIEPEWHMVKHLPGYLSAPIRAMGRQLFKAFTSTPIEKINVLANVMGNGPNEPIELNVIAAFLKKNGERQIDAEIECRELMPEYNAKVAVYTAQGYVFLLCQDFAGKYIYSWPTSSNKLSLEQSNPA